MEPSPAPAPQATVHEFLTNPEILDPLSAPSVSTSLVSISQSNGNGNSLAQVNYSVDTNISRGMAYYNKLDGETRPDTTVHAADMLEPPQGPHSTTNSFLNPQKALPSKMVFVSDASPVVLGVRTGQLGNQSTSVRPVKQPRGTEIAGSSSKQEVWNHDFAPNAEWPQEELDELMHCLKEKGLLRCLHEYLQIRNYSAPQLLRAFGKGVPDNVIMTEEQLLEKLRSVMRQALRNRARIENYTTVDDAINLLQSAQRVMVLTGAGISVACGIPDFRSSDGIYARIKASGQYEDLDDPQEMFSLKEFIRRPSMFYSFISQLWPKDVQPSVSHKFIRLLEAKNKLLRNYTQNIDSMESIAGVEHVFYCHGSFATAKCMDCQNEVTGSTIHDDVVQGKVPRCPPCVRLADAAAALRPKVKKKPKRKRKKGSRPWDEEEESESDSQRDMPLAGVMKPGITFFGEKLSDNFDNLLYVDRDEVDLLLIIGTSLKVKPVSEILAHIPHSVPQILINKTPVEHVNPDIVLLGDCERIIEYLCDGLGWVIPSKGDDLTQSRQKRKSEELGNNTNPERLGDSHIWLFESSQLSTNFAKRHDPTFTRERKAKRPKLN